MNAATAWYFSLNFAAPMLAGAAGYWIARSNNKCVARFTILTAIMFAVFCAVMANIR